MEETNLTQEPLNEIKKALYTEEDLQKKVTSEVDRRVESGIQKGLETHKQKWERELAEKAKLSAEELAKKELEEKLKVISEKEKEIARKANLLDAKAMLSDANIPKSQYEKIINLLVSDDEELTRANVQNFIDMFNSTKSEIESKIKSEFTNIPKPNTSSKNGTITKSDFMKMGYAEKLKFKQENPELYKSFIK